jgi:hypothetical protein
MEAEERTEEKFDFLVFGTLLLVSGLRRRKL